MKHEQMKKEKQVEILLKTVPNSRCIIHKKIKIKQEFILYIPDTK
jgi:hypothetical protein